SADAGRTLGQRVWSRDLRGKAVDRVADSRDAATSRSAFRWVATMPLHDARRALYQHVTAVAHRQKPAALEQLGLLDSQFVDPALLVILKNTWHAPGVAPIKRFFPQARRGDDAGLPEDPREKWSMRTHWAFAGSRLAQHLVDVWLARPGPDADIRNLPLTLHPNADVKRYRRFRWPLPVSERIATIAVDLGRVDLHVVRIKQKMTRGAIASMRGHYTRTVPAVSYDDPLDTLKRHWIDGVGDDPNRTPPRRSIDIFITEQELTKKQIKAMKGPTLFPVTIDILVIDIDSVGDRIR
ncbi:MAG: hypothetical protein MI757_11685, partial [Pirellulales bacterium]|nr:hypothetical protein [Pirellulales bacterium]